MLGKLALTLTLILRLIAAMRMIARLRLKTLALKSSVEGAALAYRMVLRPSPVIPAKAGIPLHILADFSERHLDSRLRGNDERGTVSAISPAASLAWPGSDHGGRLILGQLSH